MNIQRKEENTSRRTSSPDPSIVTFLTFRPANILNSDGIFLSGSQLTGKFAVDTIELVALVGAVREIDLRGPVTVDTPAHAQRRKLLDLVIFLHGSMTGLALHLARLSMLCVAEENMVGEIMDLDPFYRMRTRLVGIGARLGIPARIAV